MSKRNAIRSSRKAQNKGNAQFTFKESEIDLLIWQRWQTVPNCLLVDSKDRFALCVRDEDTEECSKVKAVSIADAIRWYLLMAEIAEGWGGVPERLLQAAAKRLAAN
jgi:hypothetical protein